MEIVTATPFPPAPPLRAAIRTNCRIGESEAVVRILAATALPACRALDSYFVVGRCTEIGNGALGAG